MKGHSRAGRELLALFLWGLAYAFGTPEKLLPADLCPTYQERQSFPLLYPAEFRAERFRRKDARFFVALAIRSAPNRKGSLAPTIYITESFNYAPFCCLPLQPPTSPVPSRLLFGIHGRHLRGICSIDVEYAIFFKLE